MGGLSSWSAVVVTLLVGSAVVALTVRDEASISGRNPQGRRSRLIAVAWPLTIAALISCIARIALLH